MGISFSEIGQALGGVSQGVNQGMDLYAKYDQMSEEGRKRQNQRKAEAKVAEMAKTGLFKSDPEAASRELGDFYAGLGDYDNMTKYTGAADELQKKNATRAGLKFFATSGVSPQTAINHLNEMSKTLKLGRQFNYVTNPDGTFSVGGLGEDPKAMQTFANPQEFSDAGLKFIAPLILEPKEALEFGGKQRAQAAETKANEAQAGLAQAKAGTEQAQQQYIGPLAQAEIAQRGASAGASAASAAASRAEVAERQQLLPLKIEGAKTELEGSRADTEAKRLQTATARREQPFKEIMSQLEFAGKVDELRDAPARRRAEINEREARAEALRTPKGQKLATAAAPYMDTDALKPENVPFYRRPENVVGLTTSIGDETGADADTSANTASEALKMVAGKRGRIDVNNGTITMPGNRVVKVGKAAAYRLGQLAQQMKEAEASGKPVPGFTTGK